MTEASEPDIRVGVIAVQGNVAEHAAAIERAGERRGLSVAVERIRQAGTVPDCDVLCLPGGESTAISQLLNREGIDQEIIEHVASEKPVLATCAGLIVAAADPQDDRVQSLDVLDVSVNRNAFGRQVDSFEAPLSIDGIADPETPFPAVFIRAPVIDEVGQDVEVLARWDDDPVAVRDGSVVATSFHPELTNDDRLHRLVLSDAIDTLSTAQPAEMDV